MSRVDSVISVRMRVSERLRQTSPAALWGGMVFSLFLHGSLVGILIWQMGSSSGSSGAAESETDKFHSVGLIRKPLTQEPKKNQQNRPDSAVNPTRFANGGVLQGPQREVSTRPPLRLILPNTGRNVIGPGRSVPAIPPGIAQGKVRPSRITDFSSGKQKPLGGGRTSFFKITDKGKRIVYVVDRSGSMYGPSLQMAKLQLKRSLNQLSVEQRFLVIFYSEVPRPISVSRVPNESLSYATLTNVEKVKRKIDVVSAKGGTEHMRALRMALSQRPDVVYFLTDADSRLDAGDLNTIRIFNRSKAHIHCIEFGKDANLKRNNFLTRLAEMTGGKHRYHNVKDFK